jgi:predicted RNase H-like nuclease (RuvC/YqgF family)
MTLEILDEDIEFVRKHIAPVFAARSHFDGMVHELHMLRDKVAKFEDEHETIEELEDEINELKKHVVSLEETCDEEISDYESALEAVKHWFWDVMVHHKPMSDPRRILRVVERTLGGTNA